MAAAKVAEVTQVIRHALQANNLTPKQRQALLLARKGKAPSSASTATSSSSSGSSEAAAIAWKGVGVAPVSSGGQIFSPLFGRSRMFLCERME